MIKKKLMYKIAHGAFLEGKFEMKESMSTLYCSGFQTVCRGTLGCPQKFEGCRKFFSSIRNIQVFLLEFD
jgi:hypothetical protein